MTVIIDSLGVNKTLAVNFTKYNSNLPSKIQIYPDMLRYRYVLLNYTTVAT